MSTQNEAGGTAVAEAPKPAVASEAKEAEKAHVVRKARVQEDAPIEKISLFFIDNTVFPNYRRLSNNEDIENLMESIKDGMKQNLVGGRLADGRIGLACGFQRKEARERLAVKHVVDEYNKHFGYEPKDEKFVFLSGQTKELNPRGVKNWRASTLEMQKNRRKIMEAGPEWKEKYETALREAFVNIQVKVYASATEAAKDNLIENEIRSQPSLADKTAKIITLLEGGLKPGEVAELTGDSASTISHYKRIDRLIPYLQERRKEAATLTGLSGEPLEIFLKKMDAGIAELDRRWKLSDDDPQFIQFQKLRFLSETIEPAKEDKKLPLHLIVDAVAIMTRLKNGEPTEEPTFDMGTLKQRFKDMIAAEEMKAAEAKKAAEAAAAPAAGTASAAGAAAAAPASTGPTLNLDASNAQDAALLQSLSTQTGEKIATATPAPGGVAAPTDADRAASVAQANADLQGSDADAELMTGGLEIPSEEDVAAETGEVQTSPEDGVMRAKTSEAVVKSRYTPMAPEKVELYADALIRDLNDPEQAEVTTPYDAIGYMAGAKHSYHCLGLSDKSDSVNEVLIQYVESFGGYMAKLEELLAKQSADVQMGIKSLKPSLPKIEFPKE